MSRKLKCRDPLKWISFAALMNFGSKRESLMAEIRNSTTTLNKQNEIEQASPERR